MRALFPVIVLATVMTTAGCSTMMVQTKSGDGNYAEPVGHSSVTENPTAYSEALMCVGEKIRAIPHRNVRIAVGRIEDATGTYSLREGNRVTKGASLMLITALAKMGIPQVERYDMFVPIEEMKFLADGVLFGPYAVKEAYGPNDVLKRGFDPNRIRVGYKPKRTLKVVSSDYFLAGGLSEMNFNLRVNTGELKIPEIGIGARYAVLNVAGDLRLVRTQTLEIVGVSSLQKQLIAVENKAGFFDFLGHRFAVGLFQGRAAEPIQLGVRTVLERAAIDLIVPLYGVNPASCLEEAEEKLKLKRGEREQEWEWEEDEDAWMND